MPNTPRQPLVVQQRRVPETAAQVQGLARFGDQARASCLNPLHITQTIRLAVPGCDGQIPLPALPSQVFYHEFQCFAKLPHPNLAALLVMVNGGERIEPVSEGGAPIPIGTRAVTGLRPPAWPLQSRQPGLPTLASVQVR